MLTNEVSTKTDSGIWVVESSSTQFPTLYLGVFCGFYRIRKKFTLRLQEHFHAAQLTEQYKSTGLRMGFL